ncbi:MAG: FixH family protein [Pseudomonadota bacterium]
MSTAHSPRRFTGRHMLAIMVTWFGIVITVNFTMAILANTSWTGLLAKNGYVASINYAKDAAARSTAEERGWQISTASDGEYVVVRAVDPDGAPLPLSALGEAAPRDPRADVIPLALSAQGSGARSTEPLPPGEWIIRFNVGTGEEQLTWRSMVTITP